MKTLQVLERENQRVMTTAVLAEEYETTTEIITKNFNRNKERYIIGKHYYCLEGEQLRDFRATGQIDFLPMNVAKLYLWTQKGALLHAKSLGTDRAWEVYDELVESYFRKQPKQTVIPQGKELLALVETNQQINKLWSRLMPTPYSC